MGIEYEEGVYAGFMGPYYETAAEIRSIGRQGADAVGMTTVPETIAVLFYFSDNLSNPIPLPHTEITGKTSIKASGSVSAIYLLINIDSLGEQSV